MARGRSKGSQTFSARDVLAMCVHAMDRLPVTGGQWAQVAAAYNEVYAIPHSRTKRTGPQLKAVYARKLKVRYMVSNRACGSRLTCGRSRRRKRSQLARVAGPRLMLR